MIEELVVPCSSHRRFARRESRCVRLMEKRRSATTIRVLVPACGRKSSRTVINGGDGLAEGLGLVFGGSIRTVPTPRALQLSRPLKVCWFLRHLAGEKRATNAQEHATHLRLIHIHLLLFGDCLTRAVLHCRFGNKVGALARDVQALGHEQCRQRPARDGKRTERLRPCSSLCFPFWSRAASRHAQQCDWVDLFL